MPELADLSDEGGTRGSHAPDEDELELPSSGMGTAPLGTAIALGVGAAVATGGGADLSDLPVAAGPRGRGTVPRPEVDSGLDLPAVARAASPRADVGRSPAGDDWGAGAPGAGGDLDLPAVVGPYGGAAFDQAGDLGALRGFDDEIDLPAFGGDGDLPAVGGSPRGRSDLPAVGGGFGLDLPMVGGGDLDLPTRGGFGEVDLPMVGADLPEIGGVGLPVAGGFDLPSPAAIGLPAPAGAALPTLAGVGLPSPAAIGLPSPAAAGLPSPAAGLPSPGGIGLPSAAKQSIGLPLPAGGDLPALGDLPMATSPMDAFGGAGEADLSGGFGELDIPGMGPADAVSADPFAASVPPPPSGPPPAPPPRVAAAADAAVVRQAGGGTGYGEVNLGGDEGDVPIDTTGGSQSAADDDMEFGAIPQEDAAPEVQPKGDGIHVRMAIGERIEPVVPGRRKKGRFVRVALVAFTAVVLGGGALAVTPYGPFGAYFLSDLVRGSEHQKLLDDTVAQVRKELTSDTYPEAKRAVVMAEDARKKAKRVREIKAYSAFVSLLYELRFGEDLQTRAAAIANLEELQGAEDVQHLELAKAAQEAVSGQFAKVAQKVTAMAQREPKNIDVWVLQGEVMLRAKKPKEALSAWTAAEGLEHSARTAFGLARTYYGEGDAANAEKQANETIKRSARHVGARILMARIAWTMREEEGQAMKLLDGVLKESGNASPPELVDVHTLRGDIHLARSRVSKAEEAYSEALKLDAKAAGALEGLGEALYEAGRYSEALARFEAGSKADPDELDVKVGVAKTLLALERVDDAKPMLDKLAQAYPKSMSVAYWYGEALTGVGQKEEAQKAFTRAIENGDKDPQVVHAYVSLARLLAGEGQADQAQAMLDQAKNKLPSSPTLHKALGELALQQGRYEDALAEFLVARKLAPHDIGALFKIGVVKRRNRDFDGALETFDQVAKLDAQYPGLSLERGLVYEGAGRNDEALKAYEAALAKAPDDLDLKLRVGCAKVVAGSAADAAKLLTEVLASRGNSAETNHCLGKAYLLKGEDPILALRYLSRAVELDPHKAVHHLYVGRAALDAGRLPDAERALKRALEIDQSLADAYWQRGVLRFKQTAPRDAELDLRKALELRPSLVEAHADLAVVLRDLNREDEALREWLVAIEAFPENAEWRYRYGKLLAERNQLDAAGPHLQKAIEIGEKAKEPPVWMAQAHMFYARVLGNDRRAVRHWEYFLQHSQLDNPYRGEAEAKLKELGKPFSP